MKPSTTLQYVRHLCLTLLFACSDAFSDNAAFVNTVSRVTPSIVAIALYSPIDSPQAQILGTGFVVANGRKVVTNYHVVQEVLDPAKVQYYVVLSGYGQEVKQLRADVRAISPAHDLAVLSIDDALPALTLAEDTLMRPGSDIAFTGFPIGAVLGLYPATHRGFIAAVTPDAIPANSSEGLSARMLSRLDNTALIYQLDATAYPGNSGSPVYEPATGRIIGIINKVIVRDTKESALSAPTGISYAVPVTYLHQLLRRVD